MRELDDVADADVTLQWSLHKEANLIVQNKGVTGQNPLNGLY